MGKHKYYLYFTQEIIFGADHSDFIAGRVEVKTPKEQYSITEYRIFTNRIDEFYKYMKDSAEVDIYFDDLESIHDYIMDQFYATQKL